MTYLAAAIIAMPVTVGGIAGVLKSRDLVKGMVTLITKRNRPTAAPLGRATAASEVQQELRFTQSLLALSRVRSRGLGNSPTPVPAESSSLVLVHHAQSKIPDQVA